MEIFGSLRKAAQSRLRLMYFKSSFLNPRQFPRFAQRPEIFLSICPIRKIFCGRLFCREFSLFGGAIAAATLALKTKRAFSTGIAGDIAFIRGSFCHNSDFGFFLSAAQRNHAVVVLFKSAHVRRDNFPARRFDKKKPKSSPKQCA